MTVETATEPVPPSHRLPPVRPAGRHPLLVAGALIVTFVCGGIVGATIATSLSERGPRGMGPLSEDAPRHFLERLESQLDLNEKQSEEVGRILREHFEELKKLRESHFPAIDASFEKMRADVASQLDNRQKELWNEYFSRMQHRAFPPPPGHRRGPGGPDHGPRHVKGDHRFDDRRGPPDGFGKGFGVPDREGFKDGPPRKKGGRFRGPTPPFEDDPHNDRPTGEKRGPGPEGPPKGEEQNPPPRALPPTE